MAAPIAPAKGPGQGAGSEPPDPGPAPSVPNLRALRWKGDMDHSLVDMCIGGARYSMGDSVGMALAAACLLPYVGIYHAAAVGYATRWATA